MNNYKQIVEKLWKTHSLELDEYKFLIDSKCDELISILREKAVVLRKEYYSNEVYIRGLIEISNICKNDCYYCGIRRSNTDCIRYRLDIDDIFECVREGYSLGFRTFVLQGGEDAYYTDELLEKIIKEIKNKYTDVAVTLSLGERSKESYKRLFDAGADRYLLRHETANVEHYKKLHPESMSFENRMRCLRDLKEIGYQVGAGFMVGSPYQTSLDLAKDLKFIEEFKPDMCGIGPYIVHKNTPFKNFISGDVDLTCMLLSIIRIIHPAVLLPATTALGSLDEKGREKGVLSGANVIMPNLSPKSVRSKYELYENKASSGLEAAENKKDIENRLEKIGYKIVISRGDIRKDGK